MNHLFLQREKVGWNVCDAKSFWNVVPFLGDSMNSILVLSLCPGDGWHINAAKHGCDSLPDIATIAVNN